MAKRIASYIAPAMDAANEYTPMRFCQDAKNIVLTFIAAGATATVKVYGSDTIAARPLLSAVTSATNLYVPIETINRDTGDVIDGTTGIAYIGAATNNQSYAINTDGLTWVGVKMTARAAGSVIVKVDMYDNS